MNEKWKPDDSTPAERTLIMPAAMAPLGRLIPNRTTVASHTSPTGVV